MTGDLTETQQELTMVLWELPTPSTGVFTTASASGGFTGDLTGNASTASALETARTLTLSWRR